MSSCAAKRVWLAYLDFFKLDRIPTPEEIQFYLELELMKDITITNLKALGKTDCAWAVCATGYSTSHIHKTAKNLLQSLSLINVQWRNAPQIHGRKDDDWIELSLGTYLSVLLFVPEAREDMSMEYRWLHWNDEKIVEEHRQMLKHRTRKTVKKPFINDL